MKFIKYQILGRIPMYNPETKELKDVDYLSTIKDIPYSESAFEEAKMVAFNGIVEVYND